MLHACCIDCIVRTLALAMDSRQRVTCRSRCLGQVVLNESIGAAPCKQAADLATLSRLYAEAFQKTPLADPLQKCAFGEVAPWLNKVAKKATGLVLVELSALCAKAAQDQEAVRAHCHKMPLLQDEAAYRRSGLALVSKLASLVHAVEKGQAAIDAGQQALRHLESACFASDEPAAVKEIAAFEKAGKAIKCAPDPKSMVEGSFHVAAVAALCLVRSKPVADGEAATLKELVTLTDTLRAKLQALPEGALKAHGSALLTDCEDATGGVARPNKVAKTASAAASAEVKETAAVSESKTAVKTDKQEPKSVDAEKKDDGDKKKDKKEKVKKPEKKEKDPEKKKNKKDKDKAEKKEKKQKKEKKEKAEKNDKKEKKPKTDDQEAQAETKKLKKRKENEQMLADLAKSPGPQSKAKAKAKAKGGGRGRGRG